MLSKYLKRILREEHLIEVRFYGNPEQIEVYMSGNKHIPAFIVDKEELPAMAFGC